MNVVLDTNVVVSGLLTPRGPSGQILQSVAEGGIHLVLDARILLEYQDVLRRPKFRLVLEDTEKFLHFAEAGAFFIAGRSLSRSLPDHDDEPFLEVALAAAVPLVTGNLKDFPMALRQGAIVWSPREFVESLREK